MSNMSRKTLFELGEFTSHSGLTLPFKIDCDALTDEDINCIAILIAAKTCFGAVEGIPRGGIRLADSLEEWATPETSSTVLIVDDVLTTGASMEQWKAKQPNPDAVVGWVIFARTKPPEWVNAVFEMCRPPVFEST